MDFLIEAIAKLAATPQQAKELVLGLTEGQLSWKVSPETFSARENILHLRDIDVEGFEHRVRLILGEDCPLLPNLDGAEMARARNYNSQSVQPALHDLRRSRVASMERLKSCSEGDLERTAEMQGVGKITLRGLLELWIEHDRGHIVDLVELRRALDTGKQPSFGKHQAA
jgi:hypothetical protein